MSFKPEALLALELSIWLRKKFPGLPYRFDQIDQVGKRSGQKNKSLHGDFSRGHPDLTIYRPGGKPYFLELKATATVPNTEHTRIQRAYHETLRKLGYKVDFCCGLEDCQKKILKKMKKFLNT